MFCLANACIQKQWMEGVADLVCTERDQIPLETPGKLLSDVGVPLRPLRGARRG